MKKPILDACCGSRMFWFDKENENTIFMDNRELEDTLCDGRNYPNCNAHGHSRLRGG